MGKPAAAENDAEITPQVRNGRVLLAVLGAAILLLVVPFAATWALAPADRYGVDACVRQQGGDAVPVSCGEPGAFKIVSRVGSQSNCPDPGQPSAELRNKAVLCLKPAKG
ncbi:hypothetical protein GCM10010201_04760 [Pilimelia columellifera subsp. columellifera]|uniref:Uncharacterized protein n=1 Tax=Pilimelia columellifera subsp. columellifera TaxID=706583 RepID=A0ABN3N0Y6_9ACTN